MKLHPLTIGLGISVVMASSPVWAIDPAPIDQHAKVAWSQVVDNPFDGKIVYDKHFKNDFALVTSWAPSSIRATYTRYYTEVVGYRTVWRSRRPSECNKRDFYKAHRSYCNSSRWDYPTEEPIYRQYQTNRTPDSIVFAINGQRYTYESGSVAPDLAAALASAPAGAMTIRLAWQDGTTLDTPIGEGTVAAWKTVFQPTAPAPAPTAKASPFRVLLTRQGQILVAGELLSDSQLSQRLQAFLQQNPQSEAVLKAEKETTYERVVQVLKLMRDVGGDRVSMAFD